MKNKIPATLQRFASRIESVADARSVRNGWWVYLVPGWIYDGTHQIHEDTLAKCAACLASVDACTCEECVDLLRKAEVANVSR